MAVLCVASGIGKEPLHPNLPQPTVIRRISHQRRQLPVHLPHALHQRVVCQHCPSWTLLHPPHHDRRLLDHQVHAPQNQQPVQNPLHLNLQTIIIPRTHPSHLHRRHLPLHPQNLHHSQSLIIHESVLYLWACLTHSTSYGCCLLNSLL